MEMSQLGGFGGFGGFENAMFTIVPVIVLLGFLLVLGLIISQLIKNARQWQRNNESPVLTVGSSVVAKRADVHHHHHSTGTDSMHHTSSSSTTYFVTFEVQSGDRMEFEVRDTEYGLLVEGDNGKLTFQGTRYLGFERNRG